MLQYLNSVRRKASQQLWEDLTGTKLNLSVNPGYVHVSSLNNLTLQDLNSVFLHIQHCEIFFSVWLSLELRSIEFYDLLFLFIFLQIDGWILLLFQARIKQERLWLRKSQDLFRGTKQMKCISLKKVEWEQRVICLNRQSICRLKSRVKGCLNISNFPAKKLRKNTVLKNTHAPDFFFPSYNFISLPINLYLFPAGQ